MCLRCLVDVASVLVRVCKLPAIPMRNRLCRVQELRSNEQRMRWRQRSLIAQILPFVTHKIRECVPGLVLKIALK